MKGTSYDFFAAFSQAEQPSPENVAPHECTECFDIRTDFGGLAAYELTDDVLARRADSLPLLSSTAWRYYLPAYLNYAVRHPGSELGDCLLINLELACGERELRDDSRLACLSPRERRAILGFLDMYHSKWDDFIDEASIENIRRHIVQ